MPFTPKDNKYRKLSRMNPRFCEKATNMILRAYTAPINRVLKRGTVFNLNVPFFGVIKTHGNKKKGLTKGIKKYQKKYHAKRNKKDSWSDTELLS